MADVYTLFFVYFAGVISGYVLLLVGGWIWMKRKGLKTNTFDNF